MEEIRVVADGRCDIGVPVKLLQHPYIHVFSSKLSESVTGDVHQRLSDTRCFCHFRFSTLSMALVLKPIVRAPSQSGH